MEDGELDDIVVLEIVKKIARAKNARFGFGYGYARAPQMANAGQSAAGRYKQVVPTTTEDTNIKTTNCRKSAKWCGNVHCKWQEQLAFPMPTRSLIQPGCAGALEIRASLKSPS